jgi:hypothetical protein
VSRRYRGLSYSDGHCILCGQPVDPAKTVWLELSIQSGLYYVPGQLPAGHDSQGCFPFGSACGPKELKYTAQRS